MIDTTHDGIGKTRQVERIILRMRNDETPGRKWYAKDFMQPAMSFSHPCFVGYEATARMSDILRFYPELVERGTDGRFRTLTLKRENVKAVAEKYPELRVVLLSTAHA